MILEIIAFLTGRKVIYLLDYEGEFYKTLRCKKPNPFTKNYYSYVYWFTQTGYVELLDNGNCGGTSSYIKKWMYK